MNTTPITNIVPTVATTTTKNKRKTNKTIVVADKEKDIEQLPPPQPNTTTEHNADANANNNISISQQQQTPPTHKARIPRTKPPKLTPFYDEPKTDMNPTTYYEIGIDEAGRGPLLGAVCVASVILPKNVALFLEKDIKDSKKYTSKQKVKELSDFIKAHALCYKIEFVDEKTIDRMNILRAVMSGMHTCVRKSMADISASLPPSCPPPEFLLLVDGNYFTPHVVYNETTQSMEEVPYVMIEKGDGKYIAIACASILAKHERDQSILELCEKHPLLKERYGIHTNMGYGTKTHIEGIRQYGYTDFHRVSFKLHK